MQVLLINPSKKKKTKEKSKKNSKRGAAMAKKKKTRRKTVAKRNPSPPKRRRRRALSRVRRRRIKTRRNPSMNPMIAYAIGGMTGLATSKVIDTIKPMPLPMGITAGNVASVAIGYLMYKKGSGTIKQIGTGHLASALGLTAINLLDGITGGKILGGGLHGQDEYVIDETGQIYPAEILDGLEGYDLEPLPLQVLDGLEEYEENMPFQQMN